VPSIREAFNSRPTRLPNVGAKTRAELPLDSDHNSLRRASPTKPKSKNDLFC
jgi:hypothetical protein